MRLEDSFPKEHNQATAYWFPNTGVVLDRVPPQIYDALKREVNKIQLDFENQKKYNHKLVGHIQKQYSMKESIHIINDYVIDLAIKHTTQFAVDHLKPISDDDKDAYNFSVESLWVNFQKKYEFNPTHIHTGVYSFVIWMKIPYDINEEKSVFADMKIKDNNPSNFNFYYIDTLGRIQDFTVNIDNSKEGCICLFPSGLNHSVNPFYTSDDYRISISGNIYLKAGMVER